MVFENLMKCFLPKILTFLRIRQKYIIFESVPERDGSPWMIYNELKKRGYGKKYKLVWAVDSSFRISDECDCLPFFGKLSFLQRLKRYVILYRAKLILDSNRKIEKNNPNSLRFFLRHGGPLKKCTKYLKTLGQIDCTLSLSDALKEIDYANMSSSIGKLENFLVLGFPANDRIFEDVDLFQNGFYPRILSSSEMRNTYNKVIGWLPTFRQHRAGNRIDSTTLFPMGVPLIRSRDALLHLNSFLSDKNILMVVQMHHAQAANFSKEKLSNIILVPQELKYDFHVATANLMHSFDALITDYSAAYHEYILLNRPIALSIDDYEEYLSRTGFCLDFFEWIKGVYLKTYEDLLNFIENVAYGIDSAKAEREKAMLRIHKYVDGNSTHRVTDFLVGKANL